ncbi:MAG: large conductance mechanosensitive channel protein MscL [Clostridia bacterium]|nr:large conductance mechanosensitive channel protein MscL [Clostridia bacterium]
MKKFWTDFKAFISKGNIVDLAIAVVIGAAFGKIISSLVNDVIMPLISLATGGVSIADWKWVITPANEITGVAESALRYGVFLQSILDFLIIAFFIFLAIRIAQKSKKKLEEVANEIKKEIKKKKNKKGEVVEEKTSVVGEDVVTTEKSENNKNEIINSMVELTKETQKSNRSQEKLLRDIRDLLKNK